MKLINIGFGNIVMADRIVSVAAADSAPLKRIIQDSREKGSLVDATKGRRTRAIIFADSGHIVLSALTAETITSRLKEIGD